MMILALLMIVVLAACGGPAATPAPAPAPADDGAAAAAPADDAASAAAEDATEAPASAEVVSVLGWGNPAEIDSHRAKVELFNALDNGLQAAIEIIPTGDYNTRLNAMLAAGTAPDVFMQSADFNGFYYRAGFAANLTPFLERDGIILENYLLPGVDMGNVHGNNFREAIAFSANSMVVAYNKDLFDEMGVPHPTNDWNWDDFLRKVEGLTYGEGPLRQFGISDHWAVRPIAPLAGGGHLYNLQANPPAMMANDPRTIRGIEMYVDLMRRGFMPDAIAGEALPSEQRFFSGLSGMIFFFSWDVNAFSDGIGDSFNWDVVKMPANDNGDRITLSWTTGFSMNAYSSNQDAAWEFIKFVSLSEEANRQNFEVGMPVLSSMIDEFGALSIPGTDISLGIFMDTMAYGVINPLGGAFSELADEYARQLDRIIIMNEDVTEIMNELQEIGQPILDRLTAGDL